MMKIFRCTRNRFYSRCTAQVDLSNRQGYYIQARSESDALARMALTFSNDKDGFTVEPWIA